MTLPPYNDPYEDLRHLGDAMEEPLRQEFLRMIRLAEVHAAEIDLTTLTFPQAQIIGERLVAQGLISSSLDFMNIMYAVMARAGIATIGSTSLSLPLRQSVLDIVRTYAMNRGAQRVTSVSLDTVKSMRITMEDALKRGVGAEQLGRELRLSIGLLPSHETALLRYGGLLRERNVSEAAQTRLTRQYRNRLLAWRAEMIARTETMFAVHAGMMAGWVAQVRAGLLIPARTRIEWVVTEDDRLCDRCAPMHGKRVSFGERFVADERGFPDDVPTPHTDSPYDRRMDRRGPLRPRIPVRKASTLTDLSPPIQVFHPPLHPNCRCTLRLRFLDK